MLDVLRNNAQSWIVKVLFAAIVVVFVFWGVGSFTGDREGVLAVVNDRPIKINDFIRAYENTVQSLREQNPDVTADDLREMQFKQQIFNQLLNAELLQQKAQELGLKVSASELQQEILSLPAFLSEDDRFDPQLYEGILRSHRLTPAQFERDFQQNMLLQKMENYISLPARPNEEEVAEFYNYIRSQAKIDYLKVSWEDFQDNISIQEDEIQDFYQENQSRFTVPEQIKIAYIELTPRRLAPMQDVSSEEIEDYYHANIDDFSRDEQVSARHILIAVDQNASQEEKDQALASINEIKDKLDQGADFAALASEYSDGPSAADGGDLGKFGRGQMVPEFEEVAFSLEPGVVSEPVQTQFGWHLIKVEENIPAGKMELDQVRSRIRMNIGEEKAMDQLADTMDDILEVIITGGDLDEAVQSLSLEARTTDFFTKQDGPAEIDLPTTAINKLFDMAVGETTETPVMVENGYVFAEKIDFKKAAVKDIEEVTPEITATLTRQKASDMAREKAQEYLEVVMEDNLSQELQEEITTSRPFGRQGFIPELGMSPELAMAAFTAQEGQWLDQVFNVNDGYIVAKVAEKILPPEEEFEAEKQQWLDSYADMQKQQVFESFITMLRNQAKIKIYRSDIIEN
ncbi:MAG: SurA N-terminal domain-containing protein [Desulfonatronovibrio sp.]